MRVILDTNVLLSAFIRVDSRPYGLLQAWLDGRFEFVSSAAQIEEIARVGRYPQVRRYIAPTEIGWLINRIRERAVVLERLTDVDIFSDPADNFLLGMAEVGRVDYLVTGDRSGVLTIGQHGRTKVLTVREMVTKLKLG